jgi:hypothetical protein
LRIQSDIAGRAGNPRFGFQQLGQTLGSNGIKRGRIIDKYRDGAAFGIGQYATRIVR